MTRNPKGTLTPLKRTKNAWYARGVASARFVNAALGEKDGGPEHIEHMGYCCPRIDAHTGRRALGGGNATQHNATQHKTTEISNKLQDEVEGDGLGCGAQNY